MEIYRSIQLWLIISSLCLEIQYVCLILPKWIQVLIEDNISLKPYNTFHLDVNAGYLARITQPEDIAALFAQKRYQNTKKMVLGGGSNVLFTRSFLGLILKMEISGINVETENDQHAVVSFGAGEVWHQCVMWAIENNLGGIENLSLIPGTIGAAPIQNIGAYGVEVKDVFHSLEAYEVQTGKIVRFYHEDCKFGYRDSVFKNFIYKDKFIITKVFLKLSKKPEFKLDYGNLKGELERMGVEQLNLENVSQAVINIRQSKLPDPAQIGNAGSFFKNPVIEKELFESIEAAYKGAPSYPINEKLVKMPAAWLIDQCGWKGKRNGDAGVHDKQALVIVNHGLAKGKELVSLSKEIQASVERKFGVLLETEVNII